MPSDLCKGHQVPSSRLLDCQDKARMLSSAIVVQMPHQLEKYHAVRITIVDPLGTVLFEGALAAQEKTT
jgi:hypothetical protein